MMRTSRTPEIMGDAAYVILTKPSREFTGQFCIDDKQLYASGVRDLDRVNASARWRRTSSCLTMTCRRPASR
jgi:hypothetical protein